LLAELESSSASEASSTSETGNATNQKVISSSLVATAPKPAGSVTAKAPPRTSGAAGAATGAAVEPPFCFQVLGQSKDLVGAGLAGWAQSSIDGELLHKNDVPADER
ncbi:unnamed protein product, partial [Amoebophrya sp. A25]